MKTIVLYSGGLDSTVVLAQALHAGHDVLALSINYQQQNGAELICCAQLAACWGFRHRVATLSLDRTDPRGEIPARNTLFIAKALEQALLDLKDEEKAQILVGSEPEDVYVDSSGPYIAAMDKVTSLHGVSLNAPLKALRSREEVLTLALELGVPLDLVHSSRTNTVNGACVTSKKFLCTLHNLFPHENPLTLLQRISRLHARQAHAFSLNRHFETLFTPPQKESKMISRETWGWKQSLSRLPRRLTFSLAIKEELTTLRKAALELGYELAGPQSGGMPLHVSTT